jgi:hypothetical protein
MDPYLIKKHFDRIDRISGIFFSPAAIRPPAEGRFILMILLILSDGG